MKENMWNFRWSRNLPHQFWNWLFFYFRLTWRGRKFGPSWPIPTWYIHSLAKFPQHGQTSLPCSFFVVSSWLVHPVFIDIHSKIVPTFSQKKSKVFLPPPWTPWHPLDPRDVSRLFAEARLRRDRRLAKLARSRNGNDARCKFTSRSITK